MKPTLSLPGITLGVGQPHIVVSITGKTEYDVLLQAQKIACVPEIALAEWRADYFEDIHNLGAALSLLPKIKKKLGGKPFIFTFRTLQEGGAQEISPAAYCELCAAVAASHEANLIDVQMFWQDVAALCVRKIQSHSGKVIGSWHNFEKTPTVHEIVARFETMQQLGADVLKIAVMPRCEADLKTLMAATLTFSKQAARPLCAISMGETGSLSRTHGETFGSCLTFGALDSASAPGQISVQTLHAALTAVHQNCPL